MAYMPASSNEDIDVHWGASLTGLGVQIAIIRVTVPPREPNDGEYHPATWVGDTGKATLHIGAGTDVVLEPGEYAVWSRITVGDRRPVRESGPLTVGVPGAP
jgi:quercetin dioxygenase-like cupin family protein